MTAEKPVLVDCCAVLFPGRGCSYLFIFGLLPATIRPSPNLYPLMTDF